MAGVLGGRCAGEGPARAAVAGVDMCRGDHLRAAVRPDREIPPSARVVAIRPADGAVASPHEPRAYRIRLGLCGEPAPAILLRSQAAAGFRVRAAAHVLDGVRAAAL